MAKRAAAAACAAALAVGALLAPRLADGEGAGLPPVSAEYEEYVKNLRSIDFFIPDGYRLPSADERAELRELWPTVPPEGNAAFLYVRAAALHRSSKEAVPGSRLIGNGPPLGAEIEPLRQYVASNEEAIALILKGAGMPACEFVPLREGLGEPGEGFQYPVFLLANGVRSLLLDAALVAEVQGQREAALDILLASVRIPRQVEGDGLHTLVPIAYFIEHVAALDRLVANSDFPPESLRRIMEVCAMSELDQGLLDAAVKRHIAAMKYCYRPEFWERRLYIQRRTGQPDLAARPADQLAADTTFLQNFAAEAKLPLSVTLKPRHPFDADLRKGLAEGAQPSWDADSLRTLLALLAEYQARLRGLRIRAAIMLYEKARGAPPASLEELCPEFLPQLPANPFSDQPFRYARKDGDWLFWSIGRNLADDGGDGGTFSLINSQEKDIVFKRTMESNAVVRSRK